MDRLTEKLKLLRNIVPNDDFALSTKFSILASEKRTPKARFAFPNFWPSYIIVAALILLVFFIGDIQSPEVERSVAEIATIEAVATSFESDINITLMEIRAYRDSAAKASAALYEASSNNFIHTNPLLIQEELDTLDTSLPNSQKINQLLEQIIL